MNGRNSSPTPGPFGISSSSRASFRRNIGPCWSFSLFWGGALFHGLFLWKSGTISLGQVIGFMALFNTFRFVTYISLFSFNLIQHGMASAERILSIIKTETDLDQNTKGISKPMVGRVAFESVFFSYNKTIILRHINFAAEPGTTVAIVGRTGSGKTTLVRLINRIFDPDVGAVYVDDKDVREWNLESLRSQIAVIEQDVFLFSRSIRREHRLRQARGLGGGYRPGGNAGPGP